MNIIKPKKLLKGDTVAILATSGNTEDENKILAAKDFFQNHGFNVVLSDNIFTTNQYLAGTDTQRLDGLHKLFQNPQITAIICMRGGYGAIRLIKNIDYKLIKDNPKIFCGYSDITALSLMFLKKAGLITYYGPMAQTDFGISDIDNFTINSFFEALNNDYLEFTGKNIYNKGKASGILWGGNLSTVVSLCGQDFIPDEDFIFFCEDLNEPVYKIDKMFTQLLNIDLFRKNLRGIILGDFLGVDNDSWLKTFIQNLSNELQIPITDGFKITHQKQKITLPIGAKAYLDGNILKIENN